MPIEFHCPGCGKLMRTPDETAGRKGQCPSCGVKVQIPTSSLTSTGSAPSPAAVPEARSTAPTAATSHFQFPCASCGNVLSVPASLAGKKGKCPQCGGVMVIPAGSTGSPGPAARSGGPAAQPSPAPAPRPEARVPGTGRPAAGAGRPPPPAAAGPRTPPGAKPTAGIQFFCPHCQRQIRAAVSAAGRSVQCPGCHNGVLVPAPARGMPGLGMPPSGQVPQTPAQPFGLPAAGGGPGLSMAAGGGTAPQADDFWASLPNTAPAPFAGDPFGLASGPAAGSAWDNPFASLPASAVPSHSLGGGAPSSPLGGGMANPYASPASYGNTSAAAQHTKKPKRNGLPWDRKEDSGFGATAKLVLFSPKEAFYRMHRTGGVGRPMLYCISGTVIATLCGIGYNVVAQLIVLLLGTEAEGFARRLVTVVIAVGVMLVVGLGMATVAAIAGSFVQAGLLHLCLMMVGGARQGFETTYRLWCYTVGSSSLCAVVPILGGLLALGFQVAGLIVGCWNAHETTLGRAVAAVIIHLAVGCGLLIAVVVLLVGTLSQLVRPPG